MLEKVCFICGAGHSGSTLLGLVLGSHTDCFYAGEARKSQFVGNPQKALRKRTCKLCGEDCPVWTGFNDGIEDRTAGLYQRIARKAQRGVVIDSTKNVDWLRDRMADLATDGIPVYLLYLQRDGRAVINSRLRKYSEKSPAELIEQWQSQVERTNELYDAFSGSKMSLHYEDFARNPEATTRNLTEFLGLDFQPAMMRFDEFEHHPIGGNNGTQFQVARAQQLQVVSIRERQKQYYQSHPRGIKLDLRWLRELQPEHLDLFERMAGHTNQPFAWRETE